MKKNKSKKGKFLLATITAFYGMVFVLSMLPIVMVAPYVRATGDDLNYSAGIHQAILAGGGVAEVCRSIADTVRGTWYSWQGTWSSVALFSLQPGIWGDGWYPLTIAVALICVLGGTWYFLQVVGRMRGVDRTASWGICFLTAIVMIQYLPNMKCGIFWWTSVAHYCIPYGAALACMGWSLRWLGSGCRRFMCGMLLGMAYLGGAGYPEVVLAAVWFFFVPCFVFLRQRLRGNSVLDSQLEANGMSGSKAFDRATVKRAFWLWLPLAAELVGFAVSAVAPGNKNRGGEEFGFSVSKVVWTLAACVREGITETVRYCIQVRVLLPVLLLIGLLLLLQCGEICARDILANWKSWGIAGLFGFVIVCLVRAPVLYAGTDASGGVPDSYWFITVVAAVTWLEVFFSPDKRAMQKDELGKCTQTSDVVNNVLVSGTMEHGGADCVTETPRRRLDKPCVALTAALVAFLLVFSRHFIGGTVDYTCVQFIRSGALADYRTQMEEWLDILNDPAVVDAKLPEMNDEQGPFMLMVPLDDPEAWSSQVYARYYGKRSVVCVPRS